MADQKKMVESITSMDVDFAQWYTDVCKEGGAGGLCSGAAACTIVRPYGCAIWENIQKILDDKFKADRT